MAKIAFISTMYGETWGGSEQLWGAAAHVLLKQGHRVAAGVNHWPGARKEWDRLQAAGCQLHIRDYIPKLPGRLLNRFLPHSRRIAPPNATHDWLKRFAPDLVVVCQAWTDDGLEILEKCRSHGWRYASIVQAASEYQWPDDERAERLGVVYQDAAAAFFVSRHNLELTEKQIAAKIPTGEVVWNPISVDYHQSLPWPDEGKGFRLACVGRLQPDAKGQDLLLQVLARDCWRDRPLSVTFFGKGVNRRQIERLGKMLGVQNVSFGGFVNGVSEIWRDHHAMVLPSRKEGLPIVLLEASLCGRPSICNQVAGVPEALDDGVTGFLSASAEVDLLAEAMERAWERRGEWSEMGLAAAQKVRSLMPEDPAKAFASRLLEVANY
jgi:glycosyltransferase involved in cell wall biosynthesis